MTTITWLGSATLRIDTADGQRLYVDPWLSGPNTPEAERKAERVDAILLTHGHVDHLGDTVALSKEFRPAVYAQGELLTWIESQGGVLADTLGMNKGGSVTHAGSTITMVNAVHSSSFQGSYTGEAAGFVLTDQAGRTVYIAGDTDVFGDMALIRELYEPDLAVLPIGDRMTMGPKQATKAIELLGVERVLPYHWGSAVLPGNPAQLIEQLGPDSSVEVLLLSPGDSVTL